MPGQQFFSAITLLAFLFSSEQSYAAPKNQSEEYGIASYYSDKLHGRPTASGEPYDKNDMTCAHKTYKFGTLLRVTRLDDKRSVIVRVTDRGPFTKGYVVDLSRKAAEDIDLIHDGIAKVKVELYEKPSENAVTTAPDPVEKTTKETTTKGVENKEKPVELEMKIPMKKAEEPKPTEKTTPEAKETPAKSEKSPAATTPAAVVIAPAEVATAKNFKTFDLYQIQLKKPSKKGFAVQVAVIASYENVFNEVAKLQSTWPDKALVNVEPGDEDKPLYKLLIGPFSDRKTADKFQKSASKKGYNKCFVVDLSQD